VPIELSRIKLHERVELNVILIENMVNLTCLASGQSVDSASHVMTDPDIGGL
jgi:hypothetical protein